MSSGILRGHNRQLGNHPGLEVPRNAANNLVLSRFGGRSKGKCICLMSIKLGLEINIILLLVIVKTALDQNAFLQDDKVMFDFSAVLQFKCDLLSSRDCITGWGEHK